MTKAGDVLAHPGAFVAAALLILGWLAFSPETFGWHAVVAGATLIIALFIHRLLHRDSKTLHAKVDEVILAGSQTARRDGLVVKDERRAEAVSANPGELS